MPLKRLSIKYRDSPQAPWLIKNHLLIHQVGEIRKSELACPNYERIVMQAVLGLTTPYWRGENHTSSVK